MKETKPPAWLTPSVVVLVIVNLIPLYAVLFFGWKVFHVMFLFWLENVMIGLFNIARMLAVDYRNRLTWLAKFFFIPFFCVHYGIFTTVHGVFVFALFGRELFQALPSGTPDMDYFATVFLRESWLIYPIAALFLSHGFSFLFNYIGKGEFRRATLSGLLGQPYGRVVLLHITILASGFLLLAFKFPLFAGLFLLIMLKICIDVVAHIKEHR